VRSHRDSANELATRLAIDPQAIVEAIRRGLFSFVNHRKHLCWRFGDSRNGSFRRVDGEPFCINGRAVKALAETRGESWHRLIGLDDVVANDRCDILVTPEGSKDALAALHFAAVEGTLSSVGVVMALGAAINLHNDNLAKFHGRRVRIIADADESGMQAGTRIGEQLTVVALEVQNFSLTGLKRDDGAPVKDLFDVTRIAYGSFERNRDLWSITDLDSKGERVQIITDKQKFFPPLLSLPHESPEFHVYPVSKSQEVAKQIEQLAVCNACTECDTARERRWQLFRDLKALEKIILRSLTLNELLCVFDKWYSISLSYLDPRKTRDDYLAAFLAELGKVRVPTGEGETLNRALQRSVALTVSDLPDIPGMPEAPESWRRLLAFNRELARQSANRTYFLSSRDAAKAHPALNKDSANKIQRALAHPQLGAISLVRVGDSHPRGKASEFRYLLAL
jgi:hypothetical protein